MLFWSIAPYIIIHIMSIRKTLISYIKLDHAWHTNTCGDTQVGYLSRLLNYPQPLRCHFTITLQPNLCMEATPSMQAWAYLQHMWQKPSGPDVHHLSDQQNSQPSPSIVFQRQAGRLSYWPQDMHNTNLWEAVHVQKFPPYRILCANFVRTSGWPSIT